jgi:molybdate transport system regulatory protein
LSYKAAWDSVDAMNNLAERPLLVRSTGGSKGGGSQLTEHGRELVRLYRLLESGYQRLLQQMQAQVHDFPRLNKLIGAITMRTSARNQFRGRVTTVRKGAVNSDVVLDLGDSLSICANITNEAVADLDLKPGRGAVALIKSSFVLLTPEPNPRISARNRLRGVVKEVIPGAVNAEVKLTLPGGRVLTAIVTLDALNELKLSPDSPCTALIKASHVLVAVND